MSNIQKEHIIAGVIGGAASLFLAFAARRLIWGRRRGGGRWNHDAKIVTMESENMPAAIGPYSKGKLVQMPNGSCFAWSSGQLGLDPRTNELVKGDDPVVAQAE
jgi:hypothetical protein